MALTDSYAACLIAIFIGGIALAFQSACNGTLGKSIGSSLASLTTFSTGVLTLLVYTALDTRGQFPNLGAHVLATPWWGYLGGFLGALYVLAIVTVIPRLGAATALGVAVTAQILTGCLLDHYGMLGLEERTLTVGRLIGCIGLILSITLVTMY